MAAHPPGLQMPRDGRLPDGVYREAGGRPLSFYLHIPFCTHRCGYCDFNTYALSAMGPQARQEWATAAHAEIDLARRVLPGDIPAASTIFFGGGTPSLIAPDVLGGLIAHIRADFSLADGAEVTMEANPETLEPARLAAFRRAGINRLSIGMQSASPRVLCILERAHTPGRAVEAVSMAHRAGFDEVSLDLIYGTPGEDLDDWRASLEAAIAVGPEHLSAYALVIEPDTAMGRRLAAGQIDAVDDDLQADMYLAAEKILVGAGYVNYEISNWARPGHLARHNMAYWLGDHWWGIGPGAHSHIAGMRWWNVKHPARYVQALADGVSPGEAMEVLDTGQRRIERVLLETRLARGLGLDVLTGSERARLPGLVSRGLICLDRDRIVLTLAGRLLADRVIADLLD